MARRVLSMSHGEGHHPRVGAGLAMLAVVAVWLGFQWLSSASDVVFLRDEPGAVWIAVDRPSKLIAKGFAKNRTHYRIEFDVAGRLESAQLTYRALRSAAVYLNGQLISTNILAVYPTNDDNLEYCMRRGPNTPIIPTGRPSTS